MPSYDSHDMLAHRLEPLCRCEHEEVACDVKWQREDVHCLWNIMLVLHKEQMQVRSLLKQTLHECRD